MFILQNIVKTAAKVFDTSSLVWMLLRFSAGSEFHRFNFSYRGQKGASWQGVWWVQETVREVHWREWTLGGVGQHWEAACGCGDCSWQVEGVTISVLFQISPYASLTQPSDEAALRQMLGQLVVVKLNGGLGTSMGCRYKLCHFHSDAFILDGIIV